MSSVITFLVLLALAIYDLNIANKLIKADVLRTMRWYVIMFAILPGGCALLYHLCGYKKIVEARS